MMLLLYVLAAPKIEIVQPQSEGFGGARSIFSEITRLSVLFRKLVQFLSSRLSKRGDPLPNRASLTWTVCFKKRGRNLLTFVCHGMKCNTFHLTSRSCAQYQEYCYAVA
jgi:hypothetical protein